MHLISLSLLILSGSLSLAAAEPGGLDVHDPKLLDAQGRALLDKGNGLLRQSYHAVLDQQDPEAAERLMCQVISIQATLDALVGATGPGKFHVGFFGKATKYMDMSGSISDLDGFAEMNATSLVTMNDANYRTHKRRLMAALRSQAKDLKAQQKEIIQDLQSAAAPATAGGAPAAPPTRQTGPTGASLSMPATPTAPDASAAAKPGTAAAPGQAEAAAAAGLATPTAGPGANPPSSTGAPAPSTVPDPATLAGLAQRQDAVAAHLDDLAQQNSATGADAAAQAISRAFRHAADMARAAAVTMRSGDRHAALVAAAAAAQALDQAVAAAAGGGEQLQQDQTAALAATAAGIQDRQAGVVGDAHRLAAEIAAGTIAAGDATAAGGRLAARQAQITEAIGDLKHQIDDLAATQPAAGEDADHPGEAPGDAAQPAVLEGLRQAAAALQQGRAAQEAVNATIALQQGHQQTALAAITRAMAAMELTHARLADAADAAAGGHGSDRQTFGQLQRLSTALRQLGQTAQAANDGAKAGAPDRDADAPAAALSAELGKVLDANADALGRQLEAAVAQMASATPAQHAALLAMARQKVPFATDPSAALQHNTALISAVEGLEADLGNRIAQDRSQAVLETFHKDPVPAAYRTSVADYYQIIAADGAAAAPGAGSRTAPAATPNQDTP